MNRKAFERIVRNLVVANVNDSWKGGGDPEAVPGIEADLRQARKKYKTALDKLFSTEQTTKKSQPLEEWLIADFLAQGPQYNTDQELEMRAKARKWIDGLPNFELIRHISRWHEEQRAG